MTQFGEQIMANAIANAFRFEDERYRKQINDLIDENSLKLGRSSWNPSAGFLYGTECYGRDGMVTNPRQADSLSAFLIPKMVQIAHTRQSVEADRKVISQSLRKAFDRVVNILDMRDVLPECVVLMEPAMEGLPRTREIGWSLKSNDRDFRQYLKAATKMEMYCALRFLY